jgi:uncharacterized damage-inducible protein DinB
MNAAENFSGISKKMFQYYKSLADKSLDRLNDDEIHYRPDNVSNNIAVLVKHMSGNMCSRFTDFLTSDGEKEWRNRDAEFEDTYSSKAEMIKDWEKGWNCLFEALDSTTADGLTGLVYIRNEGHTVLEAITRQVAHYAYHTGQIVYLAKLIKGGSWQSLSIPVGGSQSYNKDKFDKEPERKFFADGDKV